MQTLVVDEGYEEIRAVCIQLARAEPTRLRVVKHEHDRTSDQNSEAHEFLKFDEVRIGNDFNRHGFNKGVQFSTSHQLAEFALTLMAIRHDVPLAFEAVRETVLN